MTDTQERKQLEDKIKHCDLNSLAISMNKGKAGEKFWVVYFQRCDLLRRYRENFGEEAYIQLRGQLDKASKDYLKQCAIEN